MLELKVPKLGVNDDELLLTQILKINDEFVQENTILVIFESMKTTYEFISERKGFFYCLFEVGTKIKVGEVFGYIKESIQEEIIIKKLNHEINEINMTKKARELFEKSALVLDELPKNRLLKTDDIQKIIDNKEIIGDDSLEDLSFDSKDLLIVGNGGLIQLFIDSLSETKFSYIGYIDELSNKISIKGEKFSYKSNNIFKKLFDKGLRNTFIGFGNTLNHITRQERYEQLKKIGYSFPALVHPKAFVHNSAKLGKGVFVSALVNIGPNVIVKDNSFILDNSVISHDCHLDENVYVSPGAILAGNVTVEKNSLIGMGVTILFRCHIGSNVKINNGVNVFNNVKSNEIVKNNHY